MGDSRTPTWLMPLLQQLLVIQAPKVTRKQFLKSMQFLNETRSEKFAYTVGVDDDRDLPGPHKGASTRAGRTL